MLWKIVWANGDEVYVEAATKNDALAAARLKHGPTSAPVIHCKHYG